MEKVLAWSVTGLPESELSAREKQVWYKNTYDSGFKTKE